jgi:hypothetical protein
MVNPVCRGEHAVSDGDIIACGFINTIGATQKGSSTAIYC